MRGDQRCVEWLWYRETAREFGKDDREKDHDKGI